jgi:hypothetical protein
LITPTQPGVFRMPRPADNFTLISHEFSRSQLPARAIKVGLYILSHADGFTESQDRIATVIKMSPKTVRAALVDLEGGGFLVRFLVRENGHVVGTAYGITDQPQPLTGDSPGGDLPGGKSPAPKKIIPSKKISKTKKTSPSGGSTPGGATPTLDPTPIRDEQEEPVSKPVDNLALFDVQPEKRRDGREVKAPSPSAATVVAAFVDSYRKHHSQAEPLKRDVGRVARDAKALLGRGEADPGELERAAAQMGEGQWSNLAMALKIYRDRGNRKPVHPGSPALPHTHPTWVAIADRVDRDTHARLLVDDELVAWIGGDPAEVEKWVSKFPDLAARFEAVA